MSKLEIPKFSVLLAIFFVIFSSRKALSNNLRVTCFGSIIVYNSGSSGATTFYNEGGSVTPDPTEKNIYLQGNAMDSAQCSGTAFFCCASVFDGKVKAVFQKSAA